MHTLGDDLSNIIWTTLLSKLDIWKQPLQTVCLKDRLRHRLRIGYHEPMWGRIWDYTYRGQL